MAFSGTVNAAGTGLGSNSRRRAAIRCTLVRRTVSENIRGSSPSGPNTKASANRAVVVYIATTRSQPRRDFGPRCTGRSRASRMSTATGVAAACPGRQLLAGLPAPVLFTSAHAHADPRGPPAGCAPCLRSPASRPGADRPVPLVFGTLGLSPPPQHVSRPLDSDRSRCGAAVRSCFRSSPVAKSSSRVARTLSTATRRRCQPSFGVSVKALAHPVCDRGGHARARARAARSRVAPSIVTSVFVRAPEEDRR